MPSAACCPCGQLVGCTCTSGPACGLVCERKSGTAELCGFDEFVPSSPPKYYKRRRTTGTMDILVYADPLCGSVVTVPGSLECRSKSGTAQLIGVPEFVNPSLPRKLYRSNAASGSFQHRNGSGCPNLVETYVWSGAIIYNATTGAIAESRCVSLNGGACVVPPSPSSVPHATGWGFASNGEGGCGGGGPFPEPYRNTATKTEAHVIGRETCVACSLPVGVHRYDGDGKALLTDEDLPNDAVERAKAAIGAWTNGTCPGSSSYQTPRTGTQTDFTFRAGQTRVVITSGLTNGDNYEARIHVGRRAVGTSDPFTPTADIVVAFTASGPAYTSDWKDLPTDPTYEYVATGLTVSTAIEDHIADNWNIDEDFAPNLPAVCAPTVVADTSARTVNGAPVAWPFAGVLPSDAYPGVSTTEAEPTERDTTGTNVCTNAGSDFRKANGTVTESLSNEDTEQDAIDRATAASAWVPCSSGCTVGCTSFETMRGTGAVFGFGIVRTKAHWTAVIGTNYLVTVRFAARVLGTGGPFLFYGLTETVVTADQVNEESPWFDVPREAGMEIIAANCSVQALP